MFAGRCRKLCAEAGSLRMGKSHGRSFGEVGTGRKRRATAEERRQEDRKEAFSGAS